MMAATNTANVLMTQLCRKRRSFLVPGCMFAPNKISVLTMRHTAGKTRNVLSGFFMAIAARLRIHYENHFFLCLLLPGLVAAPLSFAESVIAPGAKLEKLAGDFAFTEGPTCDKDGNVFFVDQPNNRIMEWSADGKFSTFMQPSGYANGMMFDANGNLIACADEHNELWSIAPDKTVTVLVTNYQGKYLNGPNDVWIAPNGAHVSSPTRFTGAHGGTTPPWR